MYSHHKPNGLRHYLKHQAEAADAASACELQGEQNPLADLVAVFDLEKMQDMLKIHDRKSNLHRNHQRFLTYLEGTSGFLRLNPLPLSIFNRLDQLGLRFPNFVEVIEFYREQFALALLNDTPCFSATPLLMVGPPGVGKTAFCQALAKLIGTHFELVSLSGLTAGFVIGGMSSSWADGKPGRIVEALARSQTVLPINSVQPRGYGERTNTIYNGTDYNGSAPWVRGTLYHRGLATDAKRFSPVGTGNANGSLSKWVF